MPATESLIECSLIDLNSTSLEELRTSEGERLRIAVEKLLRQIDDPENRFGGYRGDVDWRLG
jgi:hypothetical protein